MMGPLYLINYGLPIINLYVLFPCVRLDSFLAHLVCALISEIKITVAITITIVFELCII